MDEKELSLKEGKILLGKKEIGYIESFNNLLNRIEIKIDYRGKGYGKKAVKKWRNKKLLKYDYLETSEVVDNRMEEILKDLDFKKVPKENKYFYQGEE